MSPTTISREIKVLSRVLTVICVHVKIMGIAHNEHSYQ